MEQRAAENRAMEEARTSAALYPHSISDPSGRIAPRPAGRPYYPTDPPGTLSASSPPRQRQYAAEAAYASEPHQAH